LVRHRQYLEGRITSVRSKIRHILSNYNADRKDLFSAKGGPAYIKEVPLSDADRFVIKQLWAEWQDHVAQRLAVTKKLKAFVAKAPHREAEARAILKSAPGVGFVTAEVLLSELGDISRFRNAKMVCAYAGLVPVVRQSGEKKSKNMRITKEGSGLLRWALVEAAWRLVRESVKWAARFSRLMHRSGKKRAIVAIARKLLCVLYAMLKTSTPYRIIITDMKTRRTTGKKLVRISRPEQPATPQPATATAEQPATPQISAPRTSRKQSTKAATAKQPATPRTAIAKQPATPRTVASRTAHKQSTTAATAEQSTTPPPPAARTTRKKLLTTSPPAQTTTT
jgi:hypothetical protein